MPSRKFLANSRRLSGSLRLRKRFDVKSTEMGGRFERYRQTEGQLTLTKGQRTLTIGKTNARSICAASVNHWHTSETFWPKKTAAGCRHLLVIRRARGEPQQLATCYQSTSRAGKIPLSPNRALTRSTVRASSR